MKRKAIMAFAIMLTAASLAAPQIPVMAETYSVNASEDGNEGDLPAYYGNQMAAPDGNEGDLPAYYGNQDAAPDGNEGDAPADYGNQDAAPDGNEGTEDAVHGNSISAETKAGTYTVTASSLSVRSGAGTSYSRLGLLANGTKVEVLEVKNNWGRISYKNKTGWISMTYCKIVSDQTTDKTAGDSTVTSVNYKITASSLNMRSGAGTSYSKVGTLANGTIVSVQETQNGWGKISYNGKTGWISLQYAVKTTDTTSTTDTKKDTATNAVSYKVTASSLFVRKGAGTNYAKLGSLSKNKVVSVAEISNNWGKISYNGKEGWICLKYCVKN